MMDTVGTREAQPWISMIKVAAPEMALKIIDEAMQLHGAERRDAMVERVENVLDGLDTLASRRRDAEPAAAELLHDCRP